MSELIQYLLGELSEEERLELEDRYLADPDLFHELLEVETDLYEDYARGKMSAREQRKFERQFLTAQRGRERLALLRSLGNHVSAQTRLRTSFWERVRIGALDRRHRLLATALVLLLLGLGVWKNFSFWSGRGVHKEAYGAQGTLGPKSKSGRADSEAGSGPQTTIAPSQSTFSATLMPGLFRDGNQLNVIAVPRGTSIIRLQLVLGHRDHTSHSIFIKTMDGKNIWHVLNLKGDQQLPSVIAEVPVGVLVPGDYLISVTEGTVGSAAEDLHVYACRVTKQ
jgi:hypothetical protein